MDFIRKLDPDYVEFFLDITKENDFSDEIISLLSNPNFLSTLPDRLDKLTSFYPELNTSEIRAGLSKNYRFSSFTIPDDT